ncbi:hypothetical protein FISHEDRAFT_73335 [Fistulina hepatica ATCC 64428]|uniref:Uncharacterized protein n=1 Tax=Fistulina hepatica ATCC 64428 TaxID=1128425 RepID=A0A0D7ACZ8_9AGAR|nr:hypothetical protein FISHEDRAFT_73335 [Fistulina hepatica ATCC 64428]
MRVLDTPKCEANHNRKPSGPIPRLLNGAPSCPESVATQVNEAPTLFVLFQCLPTELQIAIFVRCLSPRPSLTGRSRHSPTSLAHVCMAWRQVVLETAELWASFEVELYDAQFAPRNLGSLSHWSNMTSPSNGRYADEGMTFTNFTQRVSDETVLASPLERLLALWLARSKGAPLSFELRPAKPAVLTVPPMGIVRLLMREAYRWREAHFRIPSDALQPLTGAPIPFNRSAFLLTSPLALRPTFAQDTHPSPVGLASIPCASLPLDRSQFPQLRALTIDALYTPRATAPPDFVRHSPIPFAQLVRLRLYVDCKVLPDLSDACRIITDTSMLEELSIMVVCRFANGVSAVPDNDGGDAGGLVVRSPCLRHLHICLRSAQVNEDSFEGIGDEDFDGRTAAASLMLFLDALNATALSSLSIDYFCPTPRFVSTGDETVVPITDTSTGPSATPVSHALAPGPSSAFTRALRRHGRTLESLHLAYVPLPADVLTDSLKHVPQLTTLEVRASLIADAHEDVVNDRFLRMMTRPVAALPGSSCSSSVCPGSGVIPGPPSPANGMAAAQEDAPLAKTSCILPRLRRISLTCSGHFFDERSLIAFVQSRLHPPRRRRRTCTCRICASDGEERRAGLNGTREPDGGDGSGGCRRLGLNEIISKSEGDRAKFLTDFASHERPLEFRDPRAQRDTDDLDEHSDDVACLESLHFVSQRRMTSCLREWINTWAEDGLEAHFDDRSWY